MKIAGMVVVGVIVAVCLVLAGMAWMSRSGDAPGIVNGRLSPCPDRPSCVCSEYPEDAKHYVPPIVVPEAADFNTMSIVEATVLGMDGVTLEKRTGAYLAVTFASDVFGFRDDLEVRMDPEGARIHIRSASRVGYTDFGANRKRVETIQQRYYQRVAMALEGLGIKD